MANEQHTVHFTADVASDLPPVRFATIGSNFIVEAFLKASRLVPSFRLAAVYSRTAERAREFANKAVNSIKAVTTVPGDQLPIFTSLDDVAACPYIDAVYIASPTSEHAQQSIIMMKGGKHVLCEKPLTSHSKELEGVIKVAKEQGVAFMEAMRSLKTPNFLAVKERLSQLGVPRHFCGSFCQLSSRWPAFTQGKIPNAFLPDLSNGALMDLGCYAIAAAVALLGVPDKVQYSALMLSTGVDGGGTIVLQYNGSPGTIATLTISKMSHGWNHSEIQTEEGTIIISHLGEMTEVSFRKKGDVCAQQFGDKGPPGLENIYFELRDFVGLIHAGKTEDTILNHKFALDVARVMERARDSAGIFFPADKSRLSECK